MITTLCSDKDQDTGLKSAELAGVKEPSRYNYCVSSRDYIIKSCDIQLRKALRDCRGKSMQSWRLEGIINRWQKSMTVLQDRNTSVFEDRVSTETGSSGINTQTIKHQLQSNYCTMTSSRGASSSGDRCMSVTMEILRLLRCHPGRWHHDNGNR